MLPKEVKLKTLWGRCNTDFLDEVFDYTFSV